jgi:hypothetical protein
MSPLPRAGSSATRARRQRSGIADSIFRDGDGWHDRRGAVGMNRPSAANGQTVMGAKPESDLKSVGTVGPFWNSGGEKKRWRRQQIEDFSASLVRIAVPWSERTRDPMLEQRQKGPATGSLNGTPS